MLISPVDCNYSLVLLVLYVYMYVSVWFFSGLFDSAVMAKLGSAARPLQTCVRAHMLALVHALSSDAFICSPTVKHCRGAQAPEWSITSTNTQTRTRVGLGLHVEQLCLHPHRRKQMLHSSSKWPLQPAYGTKCCYLPLPDVFLSFFCIDAFFLD